MSAGEVAPVREAHVAFLEEHLVHAQGGGEAVAGLPLRCGRGATPWGQWN